MVYRWFAHAITRHEELVVVRMRWHHHTRMLYDTDHPNAAVANAYTPFGTLLGFEDYVGVLYE